MKIDKVVAAGVVAAVVTAGVIPEARRNCHGKKEMSVVDKPPHPPHHPHKPHPPHKPHEPHPPHKHNHKKHQEKKDGVFVGEGLPPVGTMVPHKYIVVLKKGVSSEAVATFLNDVSAAHAAAIRDLPKEHDFFNFVNAEGLPRGGIKDLFNINDLFQGLIGYFPEPVVKLLEKSDIVEFVERDSVVHASNFDTQNNAPWGLARISHRDRLNLGNFNKYLYDNAGGEGVTAYVIDTGINVKHVEFDGRAQWGKTIPLNDLDIDGNGHGTHCAGTIASKHYGIAKKANVVAVKVLKSDGSGTMSDVIKGVEYAAQAHLKESKNNKKFKGSTANMSLGGGKSPALDMAVNAAVSAGIHFAVAAGNENQDACNTSPASAEKAITVGASTLSDDRAYFSNWGKCVDIFAPGLNILSTYIGDTNRETASLSGTSMASPHVAGLLTYFLSLQPDSDSEFYDASKHGVTPAQLKKKLIAYSTKNVLTDLPDPDSPNLLIYNGAGGDLGVFWNSTSADEQSAEHPEQRIAAELGLDSLAKMVGDRHAATDSLFGQVRNLLDKMNII